MKKITIVMAAALTAVASQAAYVDWHAKGLTDYSGKSFYLFDGSDSSKVLELLAAPDAKTASELTKLAAVVKTVSSKGTASAFATYLDDTSVFAVVFKGDIAAGTEYRYITEDVSNYLYTPPATGPGTFASSLATAGTNAKVGVVPEPTGSMLLLLGLAGLALRRRGGRSSSNCNF